MALSKATFEEVLDDLSSRFIINVPDEELASVERICFQIEQAHWFYEDFVRVENTSLPSFTLKNFSAKFFQHCPLLHEWANEHEQAFANFMEYKIRVPVCGAIILNEAMDKCILVKGWNARSGWGFPKGKINKDESDTACAAREVWEETGFDILPWLREEHYVEQYMKDQRIRLYVIKGVPEDTVFVPQTRKEISKIEWHYVSDLPSSKAKPIDRGAQSGKESGSEVPNPKHPSRYFMVIPFVHKLKAWIAAQKKYAKRKGPQQNRQSAQHTQHTQPSTGTNKRQDQASSTQTGSDILKSMLGIGHSPNIQRAEPYSPHQQHQHPVSSGNHHQRQSPPSSTNSQDPQSNLSKSESLRELLGIGGMVEPSNSERRPAHPVTGQSPASSSSSVAPPPPPPALSSSNSSDTLKALLGIPLGSMPSGTGISSSPSPAFAHNYPHPHTGGHPHQYHAGHDSPHFHIAQPNPMGYSPQIHHSTVATNVHHMSAPNSPHLARAGAMPHPSSSTTHSALGEGGNRKNSVDLLALLNSGSATSIPGVPMGHPVMNGHHHYHHQPTVNGFSPGHNGHHYLLNGGSNHGSPVLARQESPQYPQHHQRTPSHLSPKLGNASSPNLSSTSSPVTTKTKQHQQSNGGNRSNKGKAMREFKFNMDGIV